MRTCPGAFSETSRDDLGAGFFAWAVLYSGRQLVEPADRVFAIPLDSV